MIIMIILINNNLIVIMIIIIFVDKVTERFVAMNKMLVEAKFQRLM